MSQHIKVIIHHDQVRIRNASFLTSENQSKNTIKNKTIFSIDAEKAFDKPTLFRDKNIQQTNRQISQPTKKHLAKTSSYYHN